MKALVNELVSVLAEEPRPALDYWQNASNPLIAESALNDASDEDRQGLDSARRKVQTN